MDFFHGCSNLCRYTINLSQQGKLPCWLVETFWPMIRSNMYSFWQALDTFNAAIVSPVYYVMFTTLTIVASAIMFKVHFNYIGFPSAIVCWNVRFVNMAFLQDWSGQDAASIASEICGFITVLTGTMILHGTKEEEQQASSGNITKIKSWFFGYHPLYLIFVVAMQIWYLDLQKQ